MRTSLLALSQVALVIVSACGAAVAPASPTPTPPAAVTYQGFKATPATLEIAKGTTVTWTNKDPIVHTITSGMDRQADGTFDSGETAQNETFSFTFNDAGTFQYFCQKHTSMVGFQIVVK